MARRYYAGRAAFFVDGEPSAPAWVPDDALFFITVCTEPRGRDQLCHPDAALCHPDAARALHESACHRQGLGHWQVPLLLMPAHVHLLARFAPDPGMTQTVADWKRYTARHAGIAWQRDFFDHRLRSTAAAREKAAYIRANPVRAGLIEKAAAWPYVWHDLTAADAETR